MHLSLPTSHLDLLTCGTGLEAVNVGLLELSVESLANYNGGVYLLDTELRPTALGRSSATRTFSEP